MRNKLIIISLVNFVAFLVIIPMVVFAQEPLEPSMPGTTQGTGTYFEITDSEYLNISLQSTEEITVFLESVPEIISLHIEALNLADSPTLTIGNLEPNTTYYKFQDSYKNKAAFVSNENGSYNWTQDLTQSHHLWIQSEDNGTVFLPEDCFTYGTWDEITSTCTLIQDLIQSVEITENNITLDCDGHSITGTSTNYGIYLNNKESLVIKNCTITNFYGGISLYFSSNNIVTNSTASNNYHHGIHLGSSPNNIITNSTTSNNRYGIFLGGSSNNTVASNNTSNNSCGIRLDYSSNNVITNNTASNSEWYGILLYLGSNYNTFTDNNTSNSPGYGIYVYGENSGNVFINNTASNNLNGVYLFISSNNTFRNNTISGNTYNFGVSGASLPHYIQDIDTSNTVDGKPIYYWVNQQNQQIPDDAGYVGIVNSINIIIKDLALRNNDQGVMLAFSNNSRVENIDSLNNRHGIFLFSGFNNTIDNNTITNNAEIGIYLALSSNNIITANTSSNNYGWGIRLDSSSGNSLVDNEVSENFGWKEGGIYLAFNSNNNILTDNNISNNYYGILLYDANNNKIYHNNFINNYPYQARVVGGAGNLFDNNYPFGGNYWSDYTGVDLYSGSNQDQPGADGIGDTPYVFTGGQDRYPFMEESGWVEKTLSEKAADLAKELVNSTYLYGGKGWDYNQNEFATSDTIKTGYTYWNQALATTTFDAGVDCSGLVMWAYDRSFDPSKSRFNNFVKAEGADEQYRYNTTSTTEPELKPGDVMFFDFDDDDFIDHVAMYVGESEGYDVISAVDKETGIVGRSKDILKQPENGFIAFKRVTSALPPSVLVSAGSPINLVVTDPDGFIITPDTIIPSELEFIREIPGVLYYSEMEMGTDGRPIDRVYSYTLKTGDYLIVVLPEPDALPTDTYTLGVKTLINGEIITTVLAEDVPISEIPEQPYLIKVTETEVIPATPMKSFTTKEMKINWVIDYSGKRRGDKTTFTISGSFELPNEYQKENLDKLALLSIKIADKLGKDKVVFKELKNLWLYQEPWKWKKLDDSLGQGIDIKTMIIRWLEEKECKFFKWWCKKEPAKNWFHIRGELSLEGIDVNTLPREATLILEIPMTSNEETGILAGIETIEFKKSHHTWFYHLLTKWKDWQDDWWKKWDNDDKGK